MKKFILAVLCCLTLGLGSAMAQGQNGQHRGGGRGGMRPGGMEQLADTAITNQMHLTNDQMAEINRLNSIYQEQMKSMFGKKDENGQKLSKEERKARMEEVTQLKKEGRQRLRTLLGDEAYIQYLEQAIDRRPMMGGGPRGMMQRPQSNSNTGFDGGGEEF